MILTYQACKCSTEGICFKLSEYIPFVKVWTCGPILWSVGWGVLRRYCRSCFNLGLHVCAVCWAHFMCHHELWPTSASHPFSFLNSSLGFARGKQGHKITIPIYRLVLQNYAIPGYFPYILFYRYLFSLLFITISETTSCQEDIAINIGDSSITSSTETPRNFGVLFDSTSCLKDHMNKICQNINCQLYW